jgi:hypothetical protein
LEEQLKAEHRKRDEIARAEGPLLQQDRRLQDEKNGLIKEMRRPEFFKKKVSNIFCAYGEPLFSFKAFRNYSNNLWLRKILMRRQRAYKRPLSRRIDSDSSNEL